MVSFNPSPKRQWLYAALAFVAISVLVMAMSVFLHTELDGMLLIGGAGAIALFYSFSAAAVSRLTTYSLDGDSLVMERSGISVHRQVIPLKSIDNLHSRASLVGRLLSITDVYVDTPGGFGCELVMNDILQKDAGLLMEQVQKLKQ